MEEGDWGGAKEREHLQPKPANSIFLCSKSGCKMLIGRDMSRESVNYSWAVRLASAYFNMITIAFKTLVHPLEYAITSLICKLNDFFSLKRQIANIQLGQCGIFHGYIAHTGTP